MTEWPADASTVGRRHPPPARSTGAGPERRDPWYARLAFYVCGDTAACARILAVLVVAGAVIGLALAGLVVLVGHGTYTGVGDRGLAAALGAGAGTLGATVGRSTQRRRRGRRNARRPS